MRVLLTAHDGATGARSTVFLDVDRAEPVAVLQRHLVAVTGADVSGAAHHLAVDGVVVDPRTSIQDAGVHEGSFVSLLPAGSAPPARTRMVNATLQLRIVSGLDAGRILHVGSGSVLIGTRQGSDVVVTDPAAGQIDVVLVIDAVGLVTVAVPPEHSPAARFRGEAVVDGTVLSPGDQLVYEDRIIEIAVPIVAPAALEADPASGDWRYNRPPRILPPEPSSVFRLPPEPVEPDRPPLPILMSLLPLVMAVGLAVLYQNPVMLAFGLMSPVMLVGSFVTNRRTSRRRYRRQLVEYTDVKERTEADAASALAEERVQRLLDLPDPALVGLVAVGPTPRLWERRVDESVWLSLRLGTATQSSKVTLEDPEQLQHKQRVVWDIHDAPVAVSLPESGVVGIAGVDGSPELPRRIAQWLTAQIGVLHSPKDAQLYLLEAYAEPSSPLHPHPWEFLVWLPHTRPGYGQNALRTVAATTQALGARIAELVQLLDTRRAVRRESGGSAQLGAAVVVVLDGAARLRPMPGIVRILKEGPAVGIYAICVERDERLLPEECDTVLIADGHRGVLRTQRTQAHASVLLDLVDDAWLDWTARAIAPIVDISPSLSDAAIPESSRLLEVLHLDPPAADAIRARWALNPRSTTATIGESLDGPFAIDLVADGPHGLVGGTTGSGKSEFLQTLVASLAVTNSPAEMNFVLVDYKGGAAFKSCRALPHTVGMVTDLDAHLVERALASLSAELRRREHLLAVAEAKDIEDYQDLASRKSLAPIPRLLVVVDEFASLARELPDFVTGLVNLAQRGRSLGIHLILATQRPGGAVSPEIRANTNLRIALRMTDGAESADVIDAPDAGTISPAQRGRAYARLGANALIPFQTSRVGGRTPQADEEQETPDPIVRVIPFLDLAEPAPQRDVSTGGQTDAENTDLRALVTAITAAAREARIPAQREPWLPALPAQLALDQIEERVSAADKRTDTTIWFGLEDHPDQQSQRPAVLDPADLGHLYIVGAARTGKTTALRTIAVSAASSHTTSDLHLYVIDCGNGGLLPLRGFPHVGAVVLRHQADQIARLFAKLKAMVKHRQEELATAGVSDLTQLRAHRAAAGADAPARVLVLLDGWETFQATFDTPGSDLLDTVVYLLREGASAGIHLVVSGDRHLLTSGRMSTLSDSKLLLRLVERSDYSFIGLSPRSLPDTIPNGRAFRSSDGAELQIAAIDPGLPPAEQSARIAALGAALAERDRAVGQEARPFTVAEMPVRYTYDAALAERGTLESDGRLFLGLGGEDVAPLSVDLRVTPGFVVAGPPGAGRSTALLGLAQSALRQGHELIVLSPRSSPLRALGGTPGVLTVLTGTDLAEDDLSPHLTGAGTRLRVLIADDADLLRDISAKAWLRALVPQARDRGLAFVIGGDPDTLGAGFSSWTLEVIKARAGVVLRPTKLADGDVAGLKLSRADIDAVTDHPIGRGYTGGPGNAPILVQVPFTASGAES